MTITAPVKTVYQVQLIRVTANPEFFQEVDTQIAAIESEQAPELDSLRGWVREVYGAGWEPVQAWISEPDGEF